jgi:hypothetical protein
MEHTYHYDIKHLNTFWYGKYSKKYIEIISDSVAWIPLPLTTILNLYLQLVNISQCQWGMENHKECIWKICVPRWSTHLHSSYSTVSNWICLLALSSEEKNDLRNTVEWIWSWIYLWARGSQTVATPPEERGCCWSSEEARVVCMRDIYFEKNMGARYFGRHFAWFKYEACFIL